MANWDDFCKVLLHFTTMVAKEEWKMISPLQRWTKGEKEERETGTKLESLKNPKKAKRNKGEKIKPRGREEVTEIIEERVAMSKIPLALLR